MEETLPLGIHRADRNRNDMRKIIIEPSLLAADYSRLGEQARAAEAAGAEAIQIDVMDGHFVPNLTFGPGIVKALRPLVHLKLDAHLMIDNPDSFVRIFAEAGADRLIVHQEVCADLRRTLQTIRGLGVEAGIAINPETALGVLDEVLEEADVIQIMTVHPGFGGQEFISAQLEKIKHLSGRLLARGLHTPIAVDGGIDERTAPLAVAAGASVLVTGSAIFNRRASVKENISSLRACAREGIHDA
jgi:ribulose-phosphate 3-epimerase